MPATAGFGERLNAIMSANWVTQAELSRKSGVSRVTINAWLQGAVPVQMSPVRKVAEALSVPFESLWGEVRAADLDEQTRLARLELFAQRVQQLVEELDLQSMRGLPTGEEFNGRRADEAAPAEYGIDARRDAPVAEGDPKPAAPKKRRRSR